MMLKDGLYSGAWDPIGGALRLQARHGDKAMDIPSFYSYIADEIR
jgi:hypothetical protein